jgi:hypothetical protein
MAKSSKKIDVYLEIGSKRTFAGALNWPGWCRSGSDQDSALQALFDYGPLYTRVLRTTRLGFHTPTDISAFTVIERLKGDATTDFGAPGIVPASDTKPLAEAELRRLKRLLRAYWRAFDATTKAASGKALRTGPRGGGRNVKGIIQHLLGSDAGYLAAAGVKLHPDDKASVSAQLDQTRQVILSTLASAARGEIAARGPRGGIRWPPRYFVRRVAWHVLDHMWEIEDRV